MGKEDFNQYYTIAIGKRIQNELNSICFSSPEDIFIAFRERGRAREKHRSVASCIHRDQRSSL